MSYFGTISYWSLLFAESPSARKGKSSIYSIISTAGSRRAHFDDFQIAAVSFIAELFFRFCCFVFGVKQLLKVKFVVYYVMTHVGANE